MKEILEDSMELLVSQLIGFLKIEVSKTNDVKSEDKAAYLFASRFVDAFNLAGAEVKVKQSIPKFWEWVPYNFSVVNRFCISKLYDLKLTTEQIGLDNAERCNKSLGVHAFKVGGFIVEGALKLIREKNDSSLIFRQPVPNNWLFVIAIANEPQEK